MSKETKVVVPGRLLCECFEPKSINGSDPKYSVSVIIQSQTRRQ